MKKNVFISVLCIIAIFLIGLYLRLYRLDFNSPSLYADEVNGHYIFRQQILNQNQSLVQKMISFIRIAPFSYTWLFGLTPIGARLASAINGSLICIGVYLFVFSTSRSLKINKRLSISIISCLISTILPWSFMVSRLYSHIPLMLFFVCLHLYILLTSKSIKSDLLSLLPLLIGTYLYMSMAVIAPFAILYTFVSVIKRSTPRQKKYLMWTALPAGLIFVCILIMKFGILNPKGRGLDLAIWNDINVTADSNNYRGIARNTIPTKFSFDRAPEQIANKLVFNYPLSVIAIFTKNYLSFFSPDFLFFKGDNVLRNSTGMMGQFWPILIPFMLCGAFNFFKTADKKTKAIFLIWILISPIPGAITKDGATYLLRVITLMPFLSYFCVFGIFSFYDLIKKKWQQLLFVLGVSITSIFSAYYFYYGYFHVYPTLSAISWEYGFKEVSDFQSTHPEKLLIIWEDKYPVGYFCFWQKLPGNVCDQNKVNKFEMLNGSRIDLPINNLLFSLPQNEKDLELIIKQYKPIYVAIPGKYTNKFPVIGKDNTPIQIVKYPDKTTAFTILKVNN